MNMKEGGNHLSAFIESVVKQAIDAAIRDGRLQPAAAKPYGVDKKTLTTKEVSKRYGVAEGTLADWRRESKGPAWTKPGKQVLYRVQDVDAFFARNVVRTLESDRLAGSAR